MNITGIMALVIGSFGLVIITIAAIAMPASIDAPIVVWYRHPVWSAMLVWRRVCRAVRMARRIVRVQIWTIEIVYIRAMVARIISLAMDRSARGMDMDTLRSLVTSLVALRLSETVRPMVREEIEHKIDLVVSEEIDRMISSAVMTGPTPTRTVDTTIKATPTPTPVKAVVVPMANKGGAIVVQPSILVTTENRPAGQIVLCVQRPGTGQIAQNNPRVAPVLCSETGKLALLRSKDGASTSVVVILGQSGSSLVYRPISNGTASRLALPVARERITVQPDPYGTKIVAGGTVSAPAPVAATTPQATAQAATIPAPIVAVKRGRGRPKGAKNGTHNGVPVNAMAQATAQIATTTTVTPSGVVVSSVPSNGTPATYQIPATVTVNNKTIKPLTAGDARLNKPRDLWLVRLDGTPRLMVKGDGSPITVRSDGPRGAATIAGLARTPCAAILPSEYGPAN